MAGILTSPTSKEYVPLSVFADRKLTLAPEEYPNGQWSEQHGFYNKYWAYYKGYILNKKNAKNQEVYPVKLNIVRSAVINHAAVLLGQFTDDKIVQFGLSDNPAIDKSTKESVTNMLNLLWAINGGDNLLLEQSIFSQVFGGHFWKVAWTPTRRKWPVRYFTIDPRACFPVWDGDDYERLVSMDVMHQMPKPTAQARYRVELRQPVSDYGVSDPDYVTVHEHWDEQEYFVKIDDRIGRWPDGSEMAGINPFVDPVLGTTIIPYVYSPRIRAGEFFGESLVPSLIGPQDEINNNLAHLGEGLADAMHQQPWVRNRPKGDAGLDKVSRSEFINLGMPQHGADSPEVGRLPGAEINQSMVDYVVNDLVKMAREHINMPDVAFGRTDASIRSALTLKFMMWPAMNTGMRYRRSTSAGLKQLSYIAAVITGTKRQLSSNLNGVESVGVDAVSAKMIEAILMAHKVDWPPMLPDDRTEMVNEVVQRITAGIISPETAVRRLDGSDELEEEMARIEEYQQKQADKAMEQAKATAELKMKSDSAGKDKTTQAQAKGGRTSSGSKE